jgi:hypothetical protein
MIKINIVKISSVWNSDRDYSTRTYINTIRGAFKRIHLDDAGNYEYFYPRNKASLIEIEKFKYLCLYKVPGCSELFQIRFDISKLVW